MSSNCRIMVLIEFSWYGCGIIRGIQRYSRWTNPCSLSLDVREVLPWVDRVDQLKECRGQGIIAQIRDETMLEAARSLGIAVVNVAGTTGVAHQTPSVVTDHAQVGRMAAADLLARELRCFAFLGTGGSRQADERGRAFAQAVDAAGCPCETYVSQQIPASGRGWDRHQANLRRWLKGLPKPVGVLACGDYLGWLTLEAAREAGLAVPDEVAVIGVGDNDMICRMTTPSLSSMALAPEQVGYEAAAMLNRLMTGLPLPDPLIRIPPRGITHRQSSNLISIKDPDVLAAVRYIRERAGEPIQVEDVLTHVPLSRRSLERRFQQVLNCSPQSVIQDAHLEQARKLLVETALSISRIAAASGFTSATRFGAVFKQRVGMTPTQYRRQFRVSEAGHPD